MRTGKRFASADDCTRQRCAKYAPVSANRKALMLLAGLVLAFLLSVGFVSTRERRHLPPTKSSGTGTVIG